MLVHLVVCDEHWQEVNQQGEIEEKHSRHAWLSSRKLKNHNVHERCNLGARYRWGIEANFLVEKHQGYHYEHCFSLNWNAMKGYHCLMCLAHLFNVLALFSVALTKAVSNAVGIPVIASGGAGKLAHFYEVFKETKATAALAASVFHYRTFSIGRIKKYLKRKGIEVRI